VVESVWGEQELVRRCKEGSEAAYAELVRQHRQRLLNLAFRLTNSRETAEDVVQETFLAAFRGMERFSPRPSLAAWITTICVRLAGRARQRRTATPVASLDQLAEFGAPAELGALFGETSGDGRDPHAAAEASELRQALTTAIATLPYKQRAAVVLRFVSGLDYAEAAQALDVPLNTYKSHLLRGSRQLRDVLQPLMLRPVGEATDPDVRTGGPAGGGPIDRASRAVPVVDDPTVAAPDGTRLDRAVPVAAASRRSARSTPMPEDSGF
jgi:RNA polymerase sigma-70 factor (ECF subfamily)